MPESRDKAGVSERATAVNATSGGAGGSGHGPLAHPCRYLVVVPSRSNTRVTTHLDARDRDEVRELLERQGDNAHRCWIVDRLDPKRRPQLEDL